MPDTEDHSPVRIWRLPMERIEKVVSAHLGPGRIRSNEPGPCFSRQISMYLAKHVGGWSTPRIGRFYNRRHHTTVLHAIHKIERLRKKDEATDALLEVLIGTLAEEVETPLSESTKLNWRNSFADLVAERILQRLNLIGESQPGALFLH